MKTNKILITTLAVMTALSILLSGCSQDDVENTSLPSANPGSSDDGPSTTSNHGITVNFINFREINIDSLDADRISAINDMALEGGYYYWMDSEGIYTLFIGLGERPTAGYGVKVISVEDNEGNTNIIIEETKPSKDDMVAQVLTYPYTIVQMGGITENFNISDTDKNEIEAIELSELEKHMVLCVYEGLMDGTSIETTVGSEPAFFRNDEMAEKVAGLVEGSTVTIIYTTNSEGLMILESIAEVVKDSETISTSGIYQGLIDGNSLEILVDGVYMAFRNTDAGKLTEGLEKDDAVLIVYSVSDEGQFLLESIKPSE